MKERFEQWMDWIDRLLVLDIFLVLAAFFWFAIALLGKSTGIPLGWELWYSLWEPVFTPAIGILMAGALLSGLIKQVTKRLKAKN
ncbi:hypothetical protein K4A83_02660 [Spirulina subsalsa FACHB-351]|uniref:Uncharacterized protein n=1 Tax=Spirulina subsalsa FACHB-351 TaxID=234711 RepID=A0ABT3L117_9CYAN|nr:hypothetical protein [Spirulina subsalsa]MCW6035176.1 hypothetical protein [Spirulina subsalsa FACHB-351]